MIGTSVYFCVLIHISIVSSSLYRNGEQIISRWDTLAKIESQSYPAEFHRVRTEDGYILELHRIKYGRKSPWRGTRPAVLLMHGLGSTSDAWVHLNPELSLAYTLADSGFDVWMGNARGNRHSRQHISLNPDDLHEKFTFFDFSWHEIGIYDLPAMVDYILSHTGRPNVHYIGHSQGGTVFFVVNSMRPEYNAKFASAHLLAAVGYMDHFPNPLLRGISANVDFWYNLGLQFGIVELFTPQNKNRNEILEGDCDDLQANQQLLCDNNSTIKELQGNRNIISSIFYELGAQSGGASVKQYVHYGQNIKSKSFMLWDYGRETNLQVYGVEEPRSYNLSLITVKTTMYYSLNDNLLDERDVLAMERDLPNAISRRVARDTFTHVDFLVAQDSKRLVNDYILNDLMKIENLYDFNGSTSVRMNFFIAHLIIIKIFTVLLF